jgi:hypothetical protein
VILTNRYFGWHPNPLPYNRSGKFLFLWPRDFHAIPLSAIDHIEISFSHPEKGHVIRVYWRQGEGGLAEWELGVAWPTEWVKSCRHLRIPLISAEPVYPSGLRGFLIRYGDLVWYGLFFLGVFLAVLLASRLGHEMVFLITWISCAFLPLWSIPILMGKNPLKF